MKYRITNRDITDTGHLYVEVKFTDSDKAVHRNDFIMEIVDGDADAVRTEVLQNIERYISRLETHAVPVDYRAKIFKLNHLGGSDPLDLKAKVAPIANQDTDSLSNPKIKPR